MRFPRKADDNVGFAIDPAFDGGLHGFNHGVQIDLFWLLHIISVYLITLNQILFMFYLTEKLLKQDAVN